MDYLLDGLLQAFVLLFTGNEETYSAVSVTVMVSSLSIVCCLGIGAPLGFLLGHSEFPGRKALRMLTDTMLSFPTVVIGLLVYAMLSSKGPLGGLGLLFTIPGIAVGQTLLGLPIVIAMTASAVENMDARLKPTLRTLGASPRQVLLTTLWEARFHMALAAVAAYGRIVSEIGISMMVGGNIKWHTRTITTAIALETGKGQFAMGIALGLVLLLVAFIVNLSVVGLRRMAER
ncbi:MAG: ABC transporter permease [Proteobacteria bacterium]|nr:ABC transporter permease [Pseudomonadota bacterium]